MLTVKPYTTVLNQNNAYWMAKLAKLAYTRHSDQDHRPDEAAILDTLKLEDENFNQVRGYSHNSSQAILVEHKDFLCMAFRGTDELHDWFDNVNAFSQKVLFGEFHRGFWAALNDIWDGIFEDFVKAKKQSSRSLFITGHSLGGAMATIAAARLLHDDLHFSSVYTFGQPRVVEKHTARLFNVECKERFFRFQNNNDLVTRVPSRLMGYSHVGSYYYISEEKKIFNDPGFWFRFLDCVDGALESAVEKGIDGIEDHDMNHYLEAVQSWHCEF